MVIFNHPAFKGFVMQTYIGTKILKAKPMQKGEYNNLRGWKLPEDEDQKEEGYLVEYQDGGRPNHPDFEGYISWSPKNVFENAYRPMEGLNFGMALEALKKHHKLSRVGWNGKYVSTMDEFNKLYIYGNDNQWCDEVLFSQQDILAEDWFIVD